MRINTKTLANETGQGNGTNYYYLETENANQNSIQVVNTAGGAGTNTYTIEATLDESGTLADRSWVDVTNDIFGAASFTASFLKTYKEHFAAIRVKVVRTSDGGANDGGWVIKSRPNVV